MSGYWSKSSLTIEKRSSARRPSKPLGAAQRLPDALGALHERAASEVQRAHQDGARRGRCRHRVGALDERLEPVGEGPLAEVEHRGLGERARELVGARDHDVGAEPGRRLGQLGVEAEVGAPGAVDDECGIVRVGDLRERPHIGGGAEVAGRHHVDAGRLASVLGLLAQRGVEPIGREPVRDAVALVDVRCDERGDETREQHAVGEARVRAPLHEHALAEAAHGERGGAVALRGAVREPPHPPGSPGLGGEALRLGASGVIAEVDSVEHQGHVEADELLSVDLREVISAVRGRTAVPGHHDVQRVALGEALNRFDVGCAALIHASTVALARTRRNPECPASHHILYGDKCDYERYVSI